MIFRNWVLENFPFIEDDFDALTDYELFCKIVGYMKKSLEKVEGFQKTVDEFSAELDEFEHYFDNLDIRVQEYFDNLDVQEEIDHKLDEMALDGTLENLISEYLQLQTTYTYNNVAEMKEATNLVNGSFCRTSGFNSYNDGGGAYYKVRTITNEDVVDEMFIIALDDVSLVAEYMVQNDTININQFGCIGDGDFDNTEILQYLINKCEDTGWVLLIPIGNFKITDTMNIDSGITIRGISTPHAWDGITHHSEISCYLTDKPAFNITKADNLYTWSVGSSYLVEDVHIEDIKINGRSGENFGITGIFASTYISTFKNLLVTGFKNDIALASCYETIVENCRFFNSYQCIVSFDNNTTTMFKDIYCNGATLTTLAEAVIDDVNYTTNYANAIEMFNYCCVITNKGKTYYDNLAIEGSCYGIINKDSLLYVNKCSIENIFDYIVYNYVNLNVNSKLTMDNVYIYLPNDFNGCKLYHNGYRSKLSMKILKPLPITNLADGDYGDRSINRIYSYQTGEQVIPLTLSDNVTGGTITNKSHFTENGFMIDYEVRSATEWTDNKTTNLTGLPISDSFGSSNYNLIISPATHKSDSVNLRVYGNGNILFGDGAWLSASSGSLSDVVIKTEYPIT